MEESKKDNGILVLTVKPKMSNEEIANLEGTYFNESDFDLIIKENADVFRIDERGNKHLLLKIRKNIIPKSICKTTFLALIDEAKKPHTNRGAAAGLLTMRKLPPYVKEIVQKGRFRGKYIGKDDRIFVSLDLEETDMGEIYDSLIRIQTILNKYKIEDLGIFDETYFKIELK